MNTRALLGLVPFLVLGAACSSDRGGDAVEVDPAAAMDAFDTAPEAGAWPRSRLNIAVLADPQGSRAAALRRLQSEDPEVRIAAIYALSITLKPGDADALARVLESSNAGERVLAAAGMVAVGDERAVPVLIDALGIEDPLPFGAPRLRVWKQARISLLSFTGQDFGLRESATAEEAAATQSDWEAWWAEAGASFEVVRAPSRFGS
jgi:HEAT repeat protein